MVQETFELKTGDFKLFHGPLSIFASVRLSVVLLTLLAATVLLGAWCPQESAVGQEKVIEQFGGEMALNLHNWGITDLFHTPYFLILVAVLSLNMIVGSIEKVFPKLLLLKLPLQFFNGKQIEKLPYNASLSSKAETGAILEAWQIKLQKRGFKTVVRGHQLAAEFGKIGRLAPTITHIGLLSLLAGVTLTSWTGFSGFKPVRLGEDLAFGDSEHSKLWIGKLPKWKVHVDSTKREDYESGEAKQWYSDLTVIAPDGKQLAHQQISVNNPLSYEGVDIYQSSWGMDQIIVAFNGRERRLDLRPMGKLYAAFLPLDADTILIFSVKDQDKPLKLFAKRPEWGAPKLLTQIPHGHSIMLGTVKLTYVAAVPVTGLQYKSDPGLPITYTAFGFIICGVLLASIPFRHVWISVEENADEKTVYVGGRSKKAKVGFQRLMDKVIDQLETELPAKRIAAVEPALNEQVVQMEDGSANSPAESVIDIGGSDAARMAAVQSDSSAAAKMAAVQSDSSAAAKMAAVQTDSSAALCTASFQPASDDQTMQIEDASPKCRADILTDGVGFAAAKMAAVQSDSSAAAKMAAVQSDSSAALCTAGFQPASDDQTMQIEDASPKCRADILTDGVRFAAAKMAAVQSVGSANSRVGIVTDGVGSDAAAILAVQSGSSAAAQTESTSESEKLLVSAGSSKGEHNV